MLTRGRIPWKVAADKSWELLGKRSEYFEDYVSLCLTTIIPNITVRDANVNATLIENGWNAVVENKNKTPDICFFFNDTLYVGDVAVSQAVNTVLNIKKQKYEPLRQEIKNENPSLRVEELSFVLDENTENLEDINNKLEVFLSTTLPTFYKEELKRKILKIKKERIDISYNVDDSVMFNREMARLGSSGDGYYDNYGGGDYVEPYASQKDDKQIYQMIWDAVENIDLMEETKESVKGLKEHVIREITFSQEKYQRRKVKSPIDIICNLDNDEEYGDLELLKDYIDDLKGSDNDNEILGLLPSNKRMVEMINVKMRLEKARRKKIEGANDDATKEEYEQIRKEGIETEMYYCPVSKLYNIQQGKTESFRDETIEHIERRKEKNSDFLKSCKLSDLSESQRIMSCIIDHFGKSASENIRSTNEVFDLLDDEESNKRSRREKLVGKDMKKEYEKINKMKAVNYLSVISKYAKDCVNASRVLKKGFLYTIPFQRCGIILTYTGGNIGSSNPTLYRVSISRFDKDKDNIKEIMSLYERQIIRKVETQRYIYLVSKKMACELRILDKLIDVDARMRIMLLCLRSGFDMSDREKWESYKKVVCGVIMCLMCDTRQNPSNILDLIKYVSGMVFADRSNIRKLFADKLNIMFKTALDMFLFERMIDYYIDNVERIAPFKEEYEVMGFAEQFEKNMVVSKMKMSSFFDSSVEFDNAFSFLQESQMLFQTRPKKLYKSQFIDKSAHSVAEFNMEKEMEDMKYGINSIKDYFGGTFDFDSKHQIDGDAIVNAINMYESSLIEKQNRIKAKIFSNFEDLVINNVSMRGSCKTVEEMSEQYNIKPEEWDMISEKFNIGEKGQRVKMSFSEPALLQCLKTIRQKISEGDTESCKIINYVKENNWRQMTYNMSEKEQRGGGRPIGSPCPYTKQALYVLDSPWGEIGQFQEQNLLAKRVNRSAKITNTSNYISNVALKNKLSYKGYLTQDQSKFSESDVMEKFEILITNSVFIPKGLRTLMISQVKKMQNRIQHFPRVPKSVREDKILSKYITKGVFIRGTTGWVQGMLNKMGTYIHILAIEYLTEIFKKYHDNGNISDKFESSCLVNSDDSGQFCASRQKRTVYEFSKFMEYGKKLFALKLNNKKSYLSYCIGEIIQKYEFNGGVVNIWGKECMSSLELIMGFDIARDTLACVGQLGTLSKMGVPEDVLIIVRKEMKDKRNRMYNVNMDKEGKNAIGINLFDLPCEMGGWPGKITTYELSASGTFSQMEHVRELIKIKNVSYKSISLSAKSVIAAIFYSSFKEQIKEELEKMRKDGNEKALEDSEKKTMSLRQMILKVSLTMFEFETIQREVSRKEMYEKLVKQGEITQKEANEKLKEENMLGRWGDEDEDWILNRNSTLTLDDKYSINESSIVRSLINPSYVVIPLQRKIHKTVDELSKYDYEGSGVGALFRVRDNIQMAVADKKENAQFEALMMSEENASRNPKSKNTINKAIKMGKQYKLPGLKKRISYDEMIECLIRCFEALSETRYVKDFISRCKNVLSDPTGRSRLTKVIVENGEIIKKLPKGKQVVNKVPYLQEEIVTENDLVSVLLEIVKPGFLEQQGYVFKIETSLPDDIMRIKNMHRNWIGDDESINVNNAMKIYYHYLKIRNQRYHIASHMNSKNMVSYLIDVYFKTAFYDRDLIGTVGKKIGDMEGRYNGIDRLNMSNICGLYECVKFILSNTEVGIPQIEKTVKMKFARYKTRKERLNDASDEITSDLIKCKDLVESKEYKMLFDIATLGVKKIMSILNYMITGNTELLDYFKTKEIAIRTWIKSQRVTKDEHGNVHYDGRFELMISKGNQVIVIKGVEGDIEEVEVREPDVDSIVELLVNCTANIQFRGYNRNSDTRRLFLNGFYRTTNETAAMYLEEVDGKIEIVRNVEKARTLGYKKIAETRSILNRLTNRGEKSMRKVPIRISRSLKKQNTNVELYDDIKIDLENNKITGVKKSRRIMTGTNYEQNVPPEEKTLFRLPYLNRESDTSQLDFGWISFNNISLNYMRRNNMILEIARGTIENITRDDMVALYTENFSQPLILSKMLSFSMRQCLGIIGGNEEKVKGMMRIVDISLDEELKGVSVMDLISETMKNVRDMDIEGPPEYEEDDEDSTMLQVSRIRKERVNLKNLMMKEYMKYYSDKKNTYTMREFGKDLLTYLLTTRPFIKVMAAMRRMNKDDIEIYDYMGFYNKLEQILYNVIKEMISKSNMNSKKTIDKEEVLITTKEDSRGEKMKVELDMLIQSCLFSISEANSSSNRFWELCEVFKNEKFRRIVGGNDRIKLLRMAGVTTINELLYDTTEKMSKFITKDVIKEIIKSSNHLDSISSNVESTTTSSDSNDKADVMEEYFKRKRKLDSIEMYKSKKSTRLASDIEELLSSSSDADVKEIDSEDIVGKYEISQGNNDQSKKRKKQIKEKHRGTTTSTESSTSSDERSKRSTKKSKSKRKVNESMTIEQLNAQKEILEQRIKILELEARIAEASKKKESTTSSSETSSSSQKSDGEGATNEIKAESVEPINTKSSGLDFLKGMEMSGDSDDEEYI